MIELRHIKKRFQDGDKTRTLLSCSKLSLPDCGLFFLLGPSGSGKTTLLLMLAGLDRDYEGSILVDGIELSLLGEKELLAYRTQMIGYFNQIPLLFETMGVRTNILLPRAVHPSPQDYDSSREDLFGVSTYLNKRVKQLSGGELQRVACLRSLSCEPSILLVDEATSALDHDTEEKVLCELERYAKHHLILFVTHNQELAKRHAKGILTIEKGKIISSNLLLKGKGKEAINPLTLQNSHLPWREASKLAWQFMRSSWSKTTLYISSFLVGLVGFAVSLSLAQGFHSFFEYQMLETVTTPLVGVSYPQEREQEETILTEDEQIEFLSLFPEETVTFSPNYHWNIPYNFEVRIDEQDSPFSFLTFDYFLHPLLIEEELNVQEMIIKVNSEGFDTWKEYLNLSESMNFTNFRLMVKEYHLPLSLRFVTEEIEVEQMFEIIDIRYAEGDVPFRILHGIPNWGEQVLALLGISSSGEEAMITRYWRLIISDLTFDLEDYVSTHEEQFANYSFIKDEGEWIIYHNTKRHITYQVLSDIMEQEVIFQDIVYCVEDGPGIIYDILRQKTTISPRMTIQYNTIDVSPPIDFEPLLSMVSLSMDEVYVSKKLSEIIPLGESFTLQYQSQFVPLTVRGVVEEETDDCVIYQKDGWSYHFFLDRFSLSPLSFPSMDSYLVITDRREFLHQSSLIQEQYPNLIFSHPLLDSLPVVNSLIQEVSLGVMIFAGIAVSIALLTVFVLSMLCLLEREKQLGLLQILGWSLFDYLRIYCLEFLYKGIVTASISLVLCKVIFTSVNELFSSMFKTNFDLMPFRPDLFFFVGGVSIACALLSGGVAFLQLRHFPLIKTSKGAF